LVPEKKEIKDLKSEGLDKRGYCHRPWRAGFESPFRARSVPLSRPEETKNCAFRTLSPLEVARYTPESGSASPMSLKLGYQVLIAAKERRVLQARYAVRNNQSKIPQNHYARRRHASGAQRLAGTKTVRTPAITGGSLSCPLLKRGLGRCSGVRVEIVYLSRGSAWRKNKRRQFKLACPHSTSGFSLPGLMVSPAAVQSDSGPRLVRTEPYEGNPISSA